MREKFVKSKMWIMLSYLLIDYLKKITHNALMDSTAEIKDEQQENPKNTLVISRNGLMGKASFYSRAASWPSMYLYGYYRK
ncbi:7-cyano-7-deazaguanine synthase [Candidatus Coxiella mudrowiae]|uniref:7-cyano-7-deazaguanine synthase n=1 Tax=Candidatus Coxiella mudrowiae TaxID=2054173 RepID=UPI001F469F65|nr:7-cyano-7-deazaguanine synthase [Candidatus Coxiella mudrowiae]